MATTTTGDVTLDTLAYDQHIRYQLRFATMFEQAATVKGAPTHVGSSIRFTFASELAPATTPLGESTDVTPITLTNSNVDIALAEYGNVVKKTSLLGATSYIPFDPVMANDITYNAADTMDILAVNALAAGTNVEYAGFAPGAGTRATVASTFTFDAGANNGTAKIRLTQARLRTSGVVPLTGLTYAGYIHPDVSYDLRSATGTISWRDAQIYTDPNVGKIYNATIGTFESIMWMETPRCPLLVDAGVTNTNVYQTFVIGQEALGKAVSTAPGYSDVPQMRVAPILDNLSRFRGVGWYHVVGYGIIRQAAVRRIESASSIGNNGAG